MFGDLSPEISNEAAAILLGEYFNAQDNAEHEDLLSELSREIPAWAASSPWHDGYALARDVLDEIDPEPDASTGLSHAAAFLANVWRVKAPGAIHSAALPGNKAVQGPPPAAG